MAFAIASGVTPGQGLVTAIMAGVIVSLFGGSRVQVAGPTGAFVIILADITARHGVDGLLLATAMAGAILVVFGMARLGGVLRFIPDPVIVGFTAGIGVVIFAGQWKDFFGMPAAADARFTGKVVALVENLPALHPATAALGVLALVLCVLGPRLPGMRRVPGPLIAMLGVTVAQALMSFPGVATIGSAFGGIPSVLPKFGPLEISFDRLVALAPSAFTIAMLGAIESLLSAVVADGLAGTRHDPNQELIGQGLANLLLPFFGGFAATGAIARTATSVRNGANGPLAGLVHSVALLLILLFLAPLAANIPLCALAAILFVVAWNMSEAHRVVRMLRTAPRADTLVLLTTFLLTVFSDLVTAVYVGVVLAMLLFLKRMSDSVDVLREQGEELPTQVPSGTVVFSIDGPFFFGAAENLERALENTHTDPKVLVIRLGRVPFMDITGIQSLEEAVSALERRGVRVRLCEARPNVLRKLVRAGVVGKRAAAPERYVRTLEEALGSGS